MGFSSFFLTLDRLLFFDVFFFVYWTYGDQVFPPSSPFVLVSFFFDFFFRSVFFPNRSLDLLSMSFAFFYFFSCYSIGLQGFFLRQESV